VIEKLSPDKKVNFDFIYTMGIPVGLVQQGEPEDSSVGGTKVVKARIRGVY
jgi:hypothetical protein